MTALRRVAVACALAHVTMGCISEEDERSRDLTLADLAATSTLSLGFTTPAAPHAADQTGKRPGLLVRVSGPAFAGSTGCPRVSDLRGTVNGRPLTVMSEGGAVLHRGCEGPGSWSCSSILLSEDEIPAEDDGAPLVVTLLDDDDHAWTVAAGPLPAPRPSWIAPESGVLSQGADARFAVDELGDVVALHGAEAGGSAPSVQMLGPAEPGTMHARDGFTATVTLAEAGARRVEVAFEVPSRAPELDGVILFRPEVAVPVSRCEGPVSCAASAITADVRLATSVVARPR